MINYCTCGYELEHNGIQREAFGVYAKVEDFLVNERFVFHPVCSSNSLQTFMGVTLQGMMELQPNSTTGRACTERTANSFAFVQKLWELLKHYNDAFGQATLCLCAAGTHWK